MASDADDNNEGGDVKTKRTTAKKTPSEHDAEAILAIKTSEDSQK